jgi:hypothetical protein
LQLADCGLSGIRNRFQFAEILMIADHLLKARNGLSISLWS